MVISNFLINLINKRRSKVQKNYPGSLGMFFKDGGNDLIYKKLNLNSDSLVIDGGGYEGEFIDNVLIYFGCKIESFEPLQKEYDKLKKKLPKAYSKIKKCRLVKYSDEKFIKK